MKRYLIFIAAGVLGLYACTAIEPESIENQSTSRTTISIPMMSEDVAIDPSTKSYLNATSSSWSFVWEDGDMLSYFRYRGTALREHGTAEVDKRPSSVNVIYDAGDFKAGDVLYTYLRQTAAEAELSELGESNDNPSNMYFQIPSYQTTSSYPESFDYEIDHSFSFKSIYVYKEGTTLGAEYDISNTSDAVGRVPRSVTLKFKIVGYDRDLLYKTGPKTSNLHIDGYGNASVTVSFDPISSVSNNKGSVTTEVKVYVDGYEDFYGVIPVTANVEVKKGSSESIIGSIISIIGGGDIQKPSLSFSYSKGQATAADICFDAHEEGLIKPYPVRDCMPIVSKKTTITSSHIQYPEDIQSAMTMYMLGSVAEFRCYSLDENVAVGETLSAVIFSSTDGECAGMGIYDLKSGNLSLENMTESQIVSYDFDGLTIKEGKENYVSLYMVLAPGTYPAIVTFITDQHVYIYNMAAKPFSRAVKKAINCNFASPTCESYTLEEYIALAEQTDTEDEDM